MKSEARFKTYADAERYLFAVIADHLEHIDDPGQPQAYTPKEIGRDLKEIEACRDRRLRDKLMKPYSWTISLGGIG